MTRKSVKSSGNKTREKKKSWRSWISASEAISLVSVIIAVAALGFNIHDRNRAIEAEQFHQANQAFARITISADISQVESGQYGKEITSTFHNSSPNPVFNLVLAMHKPLNTLSVSGDNYHEFQNTEHGFEIGSVIGCKQFSCSGDAVRRLIMGCRRMLSVEDRAAIMAGLEAGLSQTRIAHLIGRSPSVVCREIARHRGPGGVYQAEDAGRAAQVARRHPKKRLLDRDEILRRRVIFDLSQGRTPRQISGRLSVEACGTVAPMDNSPHAQGRTISHEAIYTWIYAHPKKTLIEHGVCLPSRRWMRKKPPAGGRTPPIVGMRLIDERPDIADRMIPGNWEGDLIIGKDGASACATLVERTTRYLIIVVLPLGRRADQVCDALTRRIQGLPEGAMRTLTWDQGREMARHQRLTQDTGVEVFFAHPHSPWERGTNENTNRLIRRYLPKGTPITSHQPYLDAIAYELNNCPRATLGYRTPTEAFNQLIATTH